MVTARLLLTTVRHTRTTPLRHDFIYPGCSWLVEPARATTMPWWTRPFAQFRATDHLGDPSRSWHDNIVRFAATHDVDLDGGRILALTGARSLGHTFNPLTVYWCWDREDALVATIAEVHNTYGERHAYLVRTDERGRAKVEKAFYVSPFNDTSGHYTMTLPPPEDSVDVRVTLHREDEAPFVTRWTGRPATLGDAARVAVRLPFAPHLVTARIRLQGIRLWWRGLTIRTRPVHHRQEAV